MQQETKLELGWLAGSTGLLLWLFHDLSLPVVPLFMWI